MHLSVIIPTRNRVALLQRTLDSMATVDYPPEDYEVIVVDTASTDATKDYCMGPGRRLFRNFRCEHAERPGLHVRRHRRTVAAPRIVFRDADSRAEGAMK